MLNLIWKNFKPLQKNNVANTLLPWTSPSWVTEFIWSFPIIKGIIYCPCVCGLCVSTRVCVCACVCPRPEVDIEVSSLHLMFWARVSLCLELTGETGYKKKKASPHLFRFLVVFDCCCCLSYEVNSLSWPELFRCGVPGKACGFTSGSPDGDWGPHPQQTLWLWFPVHRERMSGKDSLLTYPLSGPIVIWRTAPPW